GTAGRVDSRPARSRAVLLAALPVADHDPGRLKNVQSPKSKVQSRGTGERSKTLDLRPWTLDPSSEARPALRSVFRPVRQGAPRVPRGFLLLGDRVVPRDGGLLQLSPDRVLAPAGGEGMALRGDGLSLRLL